MPSTRGPRPGTVPPHIAERLERKRTRAEARAAAGPWYRRPWFAALVAGAVAFAAGIAVGRVTAPDPVAAAEDRLRALLRIGDQIGALWDAGLPSGGPAPGSVVDTFGEGDAAATVARHLEEWTSAYDAVIPLLNAGGVPPAADGVRRLLLASTELSRDAVEVLGAAATVEGQARDLLLAEVRRLRARAVDHERSARTLAATLLGEEVDLPAPSTATPTMPRPPPPAAAVSPTDESGTASSPAPSATMEAQPTPGAS